MTDAGPAWPQRRLATMLGIAAVMLSLGTAAIAQTAPGTPAATTSAPTRTTTPDPAPAQGISAPAPTRGVTTPPTTAAPAAPVAPATPTTSAPASPTPVPPTAAPLQPAMPTIASAEATSLVSANVLAAARAVITTNDGIVLSEISLSTFEQVVLVYRAPANSLPTIAAALTILDANSVSADRTIYSLTQGKPRVYARAITAWPRMRACPVAGNITIGVLDGPVAIAALAKSADIVEKSFGTGPAQPIATAHGTAVTGILVGGISGDEPGLLPHTHIRHAAVFRDHADGTRAEIDLVAAGLDWLKGEQVRVINFSFAGPENAVLSALLSALARDGIALVAAAGNTSPGTAQGPAFPAQHGDVLAITALDTRMVAARDANQGDFVDLAAPGVDIYVPTPEGGGRYASGTSFAAPFASALLALQLANAPRLSPGIAALILLESAIDLGSTGKDPVFGAGLIQANPQLCGLL